MKTALIFLCFIQFPLILKSQEKITLFYNSNHEITQKEKAIYYREAEYNLNNVRLNGSVYDYNFLDTLLMEGYYLNGKRNGDFTFYYETGIVKSKGKYENSKRIGEWVYFYKNEKLKQRIFFPKSKNPLDFSVIEYYDQDGNQLIKNGTGTWINDSIYSGFFDRGSMKRVTGCFVDSLKHKRWKLIRISDNKVMHNETFKKGKFIRATIFTPDSHDYGNIYSEVVDKFPDENLPKLKKTENFELDTAVYG